MNKVILMGRLTRDPDVRYTQGDKSMCIARYNLAVDRRTKREGSDNADFIPCVAFDKNGEFAERYLKKGVKIAVTGRLQTGSYTNRDGVKVYTTDVIVEEQEFAESKNSGEASKKTQGEQKPQSAPKPQEEAGIDGFMNIPDGIDEELPFN